MYAIRSYYVISADGEIDEIAFVAMIDALVAANDYYVKLGDAIGTDGYAEDADISAGDVAQAAIVSAVIASIASNPPAGYSSGEYLYA